MSPDRESPDYWRFINVKPRLVGAGGEHEVFTAPGNAGYVVKINRLFVSSYLRGALGIEDLREALTRRKERQEALTQSFGKSHVVDEYSDLMEVPLSAEKVADIAPDYTLTKGQHFYNIPTMVVFQQVIPALEKESPLSKRAVVSLGDGDYAEQRIDPRDTEAFALYETASNALILGRGELPLLPRYSHSGIWAPSTWKQIYSPDWRSPAMHALAAGFRAFTRNTAHRGGGEALDLTGENNVFIYPQAYNNQETDFTLIDALYPHPALTMQQIHDLLLRANEDTMPEFSLSEKVKLMNGVNYLRSANGIIDFNDSGVDFINLFPESISWRPDIWRRVFTLSREYLYEKGRVDSVPHIL